MAKNDLTLKQETACNAYIETGDKSKAFRMAYSCDKMKPETINRKAHFFFNQDKIRARVKLLQSELKKTSDIKKEAILEELSCFAFADIRDYVEFDGTTVKFKAFDKLTDKQARAIESISQNRQGIKLTLHGKSWTIERICRMLGYDEPTEIGIVEKGSVSIREWLKQRGKSKSEK